jgi:hypothetical protein
MQPNIGYETQAATEMLASSCMYCGKPLQQPHSIEQGCGDICADKYRVFSAAEGGFDEGRVRAALDMAPETMREQVAKALADEGAEAAMKKINHIAGYHWQRKTENWGHYMGSAIELADAMGFDGVAQKLKSRYIEGEGGRKTGLLVEEDRREGYWRFASPWIANPSIRKNNKSAMYGAGARMEKVGSDWFWYFPADKWLHVVNALVHAYAGSLGMLPNGEPFVVPAEPVAVPAPPGEAAGAPDRVEEPKVKEAELDKGQVLTLRDGREVVVAWIGSGRVGVVPLAKAEESMREKGYLWRRITGDYEFMGTEEVATIKAPQVEVEAVEEIVEAPVPKRVANRPLPEEMFAFQREGALWLDTKGSGILAFDMGLGKTLTSIAIIDTPAVVVCPASLRINWVREVTRWRPDLTVASVGVAEVQTKGGKKIKKLPSKITDEQLKADVVVINYDILKTDNLKKLVDRRPATLIVDESHYIKELKLKWNRARRVHEVAKGGSARAGHVWTLAQSSARRILLTGTPMVNGRPYELWPQLNVVDPREWGSFFKYCQRYCDPQPVPGGRGTDFTGASNLSELHDRIQGKFLLRRTKDELADQLPDKQRRSILVSMDEATSKEYKRAAAEFLKWVKDTGGVEAFDRARRAEALNRLTTLRRLAAVGKTEAFIEQCMQHLQSTGRPLIVMAHHREVTEAVTEALVQNGVKAAMYTGSESAVRKAEIKDWFQDGKPADAPPEARDYLDVLVCSITAAGVGLTLTRAQDMFFAERTWRPYDLVQAEDRIYRIGQKNNATITYYDAAGTIDEYLAEMLVQKMRAAEEVINGTDPSDEDEAASFLLEAMFHYKPGEHKRNPAELGDIDEYEWAQPEL